MTLLIKAGTGLAAGVVAGALGLAFLPHVEPTVVQPKAAVEKPQFVDAAPSSKSPDSSAPRATPAVAVATESAGRSKGAETPDVKQIAPALKSSASIAVAEIDPPKPTPVTRGVTFADDSAPTTKATPAPLPLKPSTASELAEVGNAPASAASADFSVQGLIALAKGDLSSARLYLCRAAEAGEPRAWVALADSYDPVVLAKLGVVGAPGDGQREKDYLAKAAAAGVVAAKDRMAALDQGLR